MNISKKHVLEALIVIIFLYGIIIVFGERYLGRLSYFVLYLLVSFGLYIFYTLRTKRLKSELSQYKKITTR